MQPAVLVFLPTYGDGIVHCCILPAYMVDLLVSLLTFVTACLPSRRVGLIFVDEFLQDHTS